MTKQPTGEHDDGETGRVRGEWFAQQLGERWRTTGDGIYRYAADPATSGSAKDSTDKDPRAARGRRGRRT
jgi:hypothetical protein